MLAKIVISVAGVVLIVAVNWYFLGDLLRWSGKERGHDAGE